MQTDPEKTDSLRFYEEVFKSHYKGLVMHAFYLLKDDMEAEDLVQSFFLDAWKRRLLEEVNSSLKSYLYTSIRNRCFNVIAKRKTEDERKESYLYGRDEVAYDQYECYEQATRVQAVLSQLPKQRLDVVNLVYFQDKKYREAAQEMGISINSIKTHLRLAGKVLRIKLSKLK